MNPPDPAGCVAPLPPPPVASPRPHVVYQQRGKLRSSDPPRSHIQAAADLLDMPPSLRGPRSPAGTRCVSLLPRHAKRRSFCLTETLEESLLEELWERAWRKAGASSSSSSSSGLRPQTSCRRRKRRRERDLTAASEENTGNNQFLFPLSSWWGVAAS